MKSQYIQNTDGDWINTKNYMKEADCVLLRITDSIYETYLPTTSRKYKNTEFVIDILNDSTMKVAIFEQNRVNLIHANFDVKAKLEGIGDEKE